jgi:4-hydroxybenzoate polyprenyltransferase
MAFLAFAAFSITASSAYLLNDLLDLEADRRHPRKSRRPFAAGDLSPLFGLVTVVVLLSLAALIATRLPGMFAFWLGLYFVTTLLYSFVLKRVVLIDVLVLSGLYTLRILAGAAATLIPISPWLGAFSVFFFLSLAMAKRFAELANLRAQDKAPANGRGYILADIEQIRSFGTAAAYGAVIIFILYINNPAVSALYRNPQRMWLMAPLMIWWTSRVWLLASRGELDEDPLVFALTDRVSLGIGALVFIVGLLAL